MKHSIKGGFREYAWMICLVLVSATVVMAADAPRVEEWAVAESTSSSSLITVTVSGSAATVQFAEQGQPPSALRSDVMIGGAASSSVFAGDLLDRGYSGIRLRIAGTGEKPAEASVLFRSIIGKDPVVARVWRYSGLTVSTKPGEWIISEVPLQRSAGWRTGGDYKFTSAELDAMWAKDLQNVAMMYVRFQSGGFAEQAYSVSDFRLMGPGVVSESASFSILRKYFGVDSFDELDEAQIAELMARDSDGNGMSDYHEILAGFDPFDSESVFEVRMAPGNGRNKISWNAVVGRRYVVWRSTDLTVGFYPIFEKISMETGVISIDDEDPVPDTPNFYKVITD